jgi:hypothetical protein
VQSAIWNADQGRTAIIIAHGFDDQEGLVFGVKLGFLL